MANDRLLIICKKCSTYLTLAKYWPSIGLQVGDAQGVEAFMRADMHACFGEKDGAGSLAGQSPFRLDVESSTNGPWNIDYVVPAEEDDEYHEDPRLKGAVKRILARKDTRAPAKQCPSCGCSTIGESITGVFCCQSCRATWAMGRHEE